MCTVRYMWHIDLHEHECCWLNVGRYQVLFGKFDQKMQSGRWKRRWWLEPWARGRISRSVQGSEGLMKTAVNRKVRHQESQRPGVRQTTSVASFRVRDDNSGGFKEDRLHRRSDSLPVAVSSGSDKPHSARSTTDQHVRQST